MSLVLSTSLSSSTQLLEAAGERVAHPLELT